MSDDSESAERVQFRNIGNRKHKSHLLKNRLCALNAWNVVNDEVISLSLKNLNQLWKSYLI